MKQEYTEQIHRCQNLFELKEKDYGQSWRIMRLPSLTDQIFIKANRIRTIQETKQQKVDDSIESEFVGIVNYCVMALILSSGGETGESLSELQVSYSMEIDEVKELLFNKNHDYGEAWREMRVSSMTDIILMKLLRIKQIEDNNGKTLVSEGVRAGYQDIINYSVFCLIKLRNVQIQQIQQ
jgi:hypothetical protein